MINRIWQHHFGRAIVRTPSNFGVLGEKPTHPKLLDYLATKFIAAQNIDISLHSREQRGVLHAQIDVPKFSQPLHVCCTHLNLLHGHRKRQIATIVARINDAVPTQCPLILGGDFNDWRVWATRELHDVIGVREAHLIIHGRHARTFPGFSPLLALDRIYVRDLLVLDSQVLDGSGWRALSDHLGLHALVAPLPTAGQHAQ